MGEKYCDGILVRVVCDGPRPFCAGLVIDRATDRVVFAAPILRHLMGQPADKLRQGFKRLGWRATIVRRAKPEQVDEWGGSDGRKKDLDRRRIG